MRGFGRWLRGTLGMGALWSAAGTAVIVVVGAWSIVSGHSRGNPFVYLMSGLAIWVPISFGAGVLFASLVTLAGRLRGRQGIKPWHGAAAGAVLGASFIAISAPGGADQSVVRAATVLVSLIGAGIGGGLLWVARRGETRADCFDTFTEPAELAAGFPAGMASADHSAMPDRTSVRE